MLDHAVREVKMQTSHSAAVECSVRCVDMESVCPHRRRLCARPADKWLLSDAPLARTLPAGQHPSAVLQNVQPASPPQERLGPLRLRRAAAPGDQRPH